MISHMPSLAASLRFRSEPKLWSPTGPLLQGDIESYAQDNEQAAIDLAPIPNSVQTENP